MRACTTLLKGFMALVLIAMMAGTLNAQEQPQEQPRDGIFVDFSSSTAFGISPERIQVNGVEVFVEVEVLGRIQRISLLLDLVFEWNPMTLALDLVDVKDPEAPDAQCADLAINVTDAVTGGPIANALVMVAEQRATTGMDGSASFTDLPDGSTQIRASAENYSELIRPIELVCGPNTATVSLRSEEDILRGDVSIVLTWGENPRDLDSHLTGPSMLGMERFHVYFANRNPAGEPANLDIDDVSSFGPETITIERPEGSETLYPGIYRYSVRHFSGSSDISNSNANVNLLVGNNQRNYTPPANCGMGGAGDVWTVFELEVSETGAVQINPINECWTGSISEVGNRSARYGLLEDPAIFLNLPAK